MPSNASFKSKYYGFIICSFFSLHMFTYFSLTKQNKQETKQTQLFSFHFAAVVWFSFKRIFGCLFLVLFFCLGVFVFVFQSSSVLEMALVTQLMETCLLLALQCWG